jgi:hypothetical protein
MDTPKQCRRCGLSLTWMEAKKQFGRAIKRGGLSADEARQLMPQCQKCTTRTLAELGTPSV